MRRILVLVVLLLSVVAACGSNGDESADPTSTTIAPDPTILPLGESLYRPPSELLPGPPGTLAWYQEMAPVGEARAWRTLTRSSDETGATWVTSRVFAPTGPAPEGGFPVVVWIHGTAGLADTCAPSKTDGTIPGLPNFIDEGYVVVAPDGAGLGVPGPAAYLVGTSEGRAVLDAARSATALPGAHAGHDVALFGYSSGGQAALFAAQQAADYAPEVNLVGTATVAPVSDLSRFAARATDLPLAFGYGFMTFGAWAEVYHADLSTIFAQGALEEIVQLDRLCGGQLAPHFALKPIEQLRAADPSVTAPWPELMAENDPAQVAPQGPVLIIHGTEDPIVAPESSVALEQRLCDLGADVELRMVPGQHLVVLPETPDVVRWLRDRFAALPTAATCGP
jgi:acetyl esterase/lipase